MSELRKGSIYQENQTALKGLLSHRHGFRNRFCWECQKDKPVKTGKIFGVKGKSATANAGHLRFACLECVTAREERKAAKEALA